MTQPAPGMALACAPNFRDIGGISIGRGAVCRPGLVYRSEAVFAPNVSDAACLEALAIRTVIDLRSAPERRRAVTFWSRQKIDVQEIELLADPRRAAAMDLLRADSSAAGVRRFLESGYRAFPAACAPAVRALFDLISTRRTPVLVHCTAGKDRTGFLIAMLLIGLGASIDQVLGDYLNSAARMSVENIAGSRFAVNHRLEAPLEEEAVDELLGVREEYLMASLSAIEVDYGSVPAYLADLGATAETLKRARDHLLS